MLDSFINSWAAKPIDKVVYLPHQSSNPVINHSLEAMLKALLEYFEERSKKTQ
jgi:hypothetical protein